MKPERAQTHARGLSRLFFGLLQGECRMDCGLRQGNKRPIVNYFGGVYYFEPGIYSVVLSDANGVIVADAINIEFI